MIKGMNFEFCDFKRNLIEILDLLKKDAEDVVVFKMELSVVKPLRFLKPERFRAYNFHEFVSI